MDNSVNGTVGILPIHGGEDFNVVLVQQQVAGAVSSVWIFADDCRRVQPVRMPSRVAVASLSYRCFETRRRFRLRVGWPCGCFIFATAAVRAAPCWCPFDEAGVPAACP
ncbi:hypothetical protein VSR68_23090 [Paraburkholderia phymatum]|uniref:hypothetical protein n=1 Tax=Paraburkholderia phymatum TaxID=148447 RepID=UPI0031715C32